MKQRNKRPKQSGRPAVDAAEPAQRLDHLAGRSNLNFTHSKSFDKLIRATVAYLDALLSDQDDLAALHRAEIARLESGAIY